MKQQKYYDVVVIERTTREIDSVVGTNLPMDTGTNNAARRRATVQGRCNESYSVEVVPTGQYKVGDILPKNENQT